MKKLSRMELLQLLLKASESNEALINENARLKEELARRAAQAPAQAAPAQAPVQQAVKVGSIAEAALQANGFFEAAQRSADDYLRQIKQMRDQMAERYASGAQQAMVGPAAEEIARRQAQAQKSFEQIQAQAKTYIQDVQTYANNVMARANQQAEAIVSSAQAQSADMLAQAQAQAGALVAQANEQANRMANRPPAESFAQGADQIFGQAETQAQVPEAQATGRIEASPSVQVAEAVEPLPEQGYAAAAAPVASEQQVAFDSAATGELYRRGRHARSAEGTGA